MEFLTFLLLSLMALNSQADSPRFDAYVEAKLARPSSQMVPLKLLINDKIIEMRKLSPFVTEFSLWDKRETAVFGNANAVDPFMTVKTVLASDYVVSAVAYSEWIRGGADTFFKPIELLRKPRSLRALIPSGSYVFLKLNAQGQLDAAQLQVPEGKKIQTHYTDSRDWRD